MLSDKFFFEASKRERGLMGNEPCQKHATIAPHALCSKMRIQGYKYTIGCLEHILSMIDGRCAVCTPQYNFVRLISTLEVLWQPAKCRVKVANAAAHSSRTRAKLVTTTTQNISTFQGLPEYTLRLCTTFIPESADIDKVATSKSSSFFYSFFSVWWINPACRVNFGLIAGLTFVLAFNFQVIDGFRLKTKPATKRCWLRFTHGLNAAVAPSSVGCSCVTAAQRMWGFGGRCCHTAAAVGWAEAM
jgi:hypothetical protein